MKLKYTKYRINLAHSFNISRSKNKWYDIIYVYIIDGEFIGRGEAAPNLRYNESADQILKLLEKIHLPKEIKDRESIFEYILPQLQNVKSLEAAFSMALWDWWSQRKGKTVYNMLGADKKNISPTSYTIGITKIDDIEEKIIESEPYKILKVKLGTKNDKKIITEIRKHTDKLIRVDANEGWLLDDAVELSYWLADQNIELIEQPFPANKLNDTAYLKNKSPLDIYADENSLNSFDISKIYKAFDGINIKLMKCGSIEEAEKMIREANKYKLKVMLGCMVESSVAITAASSIASKVHKIDLDGNLLITNDPYKGVLIKDGTLELNDKIGLGLSLNKTRTGLI